MKTGFFDFTKTRDVKSPQRANDTDAGIDFFIPADTPEFRLDLRAKNPRLNLLSPWMFIKKSFLGLLGLSKDDILVIPPHKDLLVPSGIKTILRTGTALIGANKSGVATKKKIVYGAHVIDSDYRGEIHLHLINTSDKAVKFDFGEKAIQFILTPLELDKPNEITSEEYAKEENTDRGVGGFGSSGIK